MIFFYDKRTNEIFSSIHGRVHDARTLGCSVDDGRGKKNIGKFIVGLEETDIIEGHKEIEQLQEISKEDFEKLDNKNRKKISSEEWFEDEDGGEIPQIVFQYFRKDKIKIPVYKKIEHNLDQFETVQKFEGNDKDVPTDYKVVDNKLIKK